MATIQTQNITELLKNYALLIEHDVGVNFIQECKLRETDRNKIRNIFDQDDYDLTCGLSNGETKKNECWRRMRW